LRQGALQRILTADLDISAPDNLERGVTYCINSFRILVGIGLSDDNHFSQYRLRQCSYESAWCSLRTELLPEGIGALCAPLVSVAVAVIGAYGSSSSSSTAPVVSSRVSPFPPPSVFP
ncbi:hypothetical protein CF326_g9165, partial [Tilletia indica]